MRQKLLIVILLLISARDSFGQKLDNTEYYDFTLYGNRIFLKVFINDKPCNFMLDIGASGTGRIDTRIVKEMGLDTVGYQDNSDGINTAKLPLIKIGSLKFGSIDLKDTELMSRDYNRVQREMITDGLLGRGFFEEYLLIIDYPNKKIGFSKNNLNPKSKKVLPFERPFVVEGKIGKKKYGFHLDTGSNLDFHFPKKVIDELKFDTTGERSTARRANTEFILHGAIVKEKFQLGTIKKESINVLYSLPQTLIFIGSGFLKSYKLTIDQRNKCLTIE